MNFVLMGRLREYFAWIRNYFEGFVPTPFVLVFLHFLMMVVAVVVVELVPLIVLFSIVTDFVTD